MRLMPWIRMPAIWLRDGELKDFGWKKKSLVQGSTAIAALQLYIAMLTQSHEVWQDEEDDYVLECDATFNRLSEITGLSRALVAAGVKALLKAERITITKDGRNNHYRFPDFDSSGHWCKLPSRALYNQSSRQIEAFQLFHKRTMCELDALKLFLFYAANRDNNAFHAMCSFEVINKKTGIPEKRIPAANAFLISVGLLVNIGKEKSEEDGIRKREANQYFLRGHRQFFINSKVAPDKAPSRTV
ncbi:DNA-binding protein [Pseudomonas juntendi]|uniref:DNA-binding protein n=1 Tax=Pseudomonas TaxID=286 RepID=UPI001EEC16A5|nr:MULTISPECIES: DNA-binding protein [Pseudomonas]MDG9918219.1 DNA-binding protein [Pseudomonas juntendi]MDH0507667.1 DNA-binding protein [Pseudomonas juntendi]MDH1044851.1 DNA-binding protein [Pseudomonas juntendi]